MNNKNFDPAAARRTTAPEPLPVLVVGAGPVGVLNALGLARKGIPVVVVERSPAVVRAPRAVVYHWATLDGLDRLGVLEPAGREGFLKQDYCFWNWQTGERVQYGLSLLDGMVDHPYNLHLGQDRLVDVVLRIIADEKLPVEVRWGRQVIGLQNYEDHAVVSAECADGAIERFAAQWVLGADGAG
ncbi:FAD-dependent oxidoreductase, partial [Nocardia sp. NPDC003345]